MPKPLIPADEPRMFVQRTGTRESGPMAWRAYVTADVRRYEGEHGTYAWSRASAERKARRLMRRYLATCPGEPVEVPRG